MSKYLIYIDEPSSSLSSSSSKTFSAAWGLREREIEHLNAVETEEDKRNAHCPCNHVNVIINICCTVFFSVHFYVYFPYRQSRKAGYYNVIPKCLYGSLFNIMYGCIKRVDF